MAITYPISFPAQLAKSTHVTWTPKSIVSQNVAEFTGAQQTFLHNGEWWEVSIEIGKLERADADALEAFILSLRGKHGRFTYGDPARKASNGNPSGSWVVGSGATAGSRSLPISGGSGAFAVGDWIQAGTQLFRVLKVNAGALDIFPLIRANIASSTPIVHTDARGIFRLDGDVSFELGLSKRFFGPYTISAREAFTL